MIEDFFGFCAVFHRAVAKAAVNVPSPGPEGTVVLYSTDRMPVARDASDIVHYLGGKVVARGILLAPGPETAVRFNGCTEALTHGNRSDVIHNFRWLRSVRAVSAAQIAVFVDTPGPKAAVLLHSTDTSYVSAPAADADLLHVIHDLYRVFRAQKIAAIASPKPERIIIVNICQKHKSQVEAFDVINDLRRFNDHISAVFNAIAIVQLAFDLIARPKNVLSPEPKRVIFRKRSRVEVRGLSCYYVFQNLGRY